MKILVLIFLTAVNVTAFSQELAPDSNAIPEVKHTVKLYSNAFLPQLAIFNGKEYLNYRLPFSNGHPYFEVDSLTKGSITYEGRTYNDASLIYNVATDQLVILSFDNFSKIQLQRERVSSFTVRGHSFINIPRDSLLSTGLKEGFYDVVNQGEINLLSRRTKSLKQKITDIVEMHVSQKDEFYIKKNNEYRAVNTERAFLKALEDKKTHVQKFIKQNALKYRPFKEEFMKRVVAYYNEIAD